MPAQTALLDLASPEATCALARQLAPRLRPGDTLLLSGGVGAGKTHFARCLIQSLLAEPEDVPSPTYTLVQVYHGSTGEIWHVDLYRLNGPRDIEELGLLEAMSQAICLIEWPDRLGALAPPEALTLDFTPKTDPGAPDHRQLRLGWQAERWSAVMTGLLHG